MSAGVAVASMGRLLPPLPLVVAVPVMAATFPWLILASDSSETTMASVPFSFYENQGNTVIL